MGINDELTARTLTSGTEIWDATHSAVPDGEARKGGRSNFNGECVTVQRVAPRAGEEITINSGAVVITDPETHALGNPVKGKLSTGNGACVTVQRFPDGANDIHIRPPREAVPPGQSVKGMASAGNGACVTVERLPDDTLRTWHHDDIWTQAAAGEPVKAVASINNGACVTVERLPDGGLKAFRHDETWTESADGEPVKAVASVGNGACVTVERVADGSAVEQVAVRYASDGTTIMSTHEGTRVANGAAVKSDVSAGNGECVTIERLADADPTATTVNRSEDGTLVFHSHIGDIAADGDAVKAVSSVGNGECVTVLRGQAGDVALWDSKMEKILGEGQAPRWILTADEWSVFIVAVRDGALSPSTLDGGYNNIIVDIENSVEIEIEQAGDNWEWSFTPYPDIVHTYTEGEMHAFRYAAYTEQFGTDEWWDGSGSVVVFDEVPRALSAIG